MKSTVLGAVQKFLCDFSPYEVQGHVQKRLNTLSGLVSGMVERGKSHLSHIGTGLPQDINALSKEIHVKRFLENKYTDYKVHYLPYLSCFMASFSENKSFLAHKSDLKLVIDGSQMGAKYVALMLSVVVDKRAIPIFWMVKKGKRR